MFFCISSRSQCLHSNATANSEASLPLVAAQLWVQLLEMGYSNSDSESSPDSSPILNELGLVTHSGEFVLGLDTDSDILDSENFRVQSSPGTGGHNKLLFKNETKLLALCCFSIEANHRHVYIKRMNAVANQRRFRVTMWRIRSKYMFRISTSFYTFANPLINNNV